jgi:oligopeptide/dipeptide ABC transporter ATP-binding protein
MTSSSDPLLEFDDVTVQYEVGGRNLTAVSNATFTVESGEYFGLVGESGCGKSTIAKAIMGGLDDNGTVTSGCIRFQGMQIQDLSRETLNQQLRWDEIALIPQGSMNSLDSLQRVSEQAVEIASVHTSMTKQESLERLRELFEIVGLQESRMKDYPHQFSGGMKQRAIIALALLLEPTLIIADEPTTALDVIMQDQFFKYLDRIKSDLDVGMILITHDISVVFESCDRLAIMHGGQIAEIGTVQGLYESPRHPYSILLQESFPDILDPKRELQEIEGHPPQLFGEVDYCTFVDRCPWAVEECQQSSPPLESIAGTDQLAACFRKDEVHRLEQPREGLE